MDGIIYPQLGFDIQGACFDTHNSLRRFDLSEAGWEKALAIALNDRGIAAHRQVEMRLRRMPYVKINEVVVQFRGQPIESRRAPLLVVDDRLMVVPLAVLRIASDIEDRYRHYLRFLGLKQGLIVNFRTNALESVVIEA